MQLLLQAITHGTASCESVELVTEGTFQGTITIHGPSPYHLGAMRSIEVIGDGQRTLVVA